MDRSLFIKTFTRTESLFQSCFFRGLRLFCWLLIVQNAVAAPAAPRNKAWKPQGELDQDFPFQNACIGANFPSNNVALKGIALKVGNDAYVCFDTDLLRMSAGWTGKYLNFEGVAFSGTHGSNPTIAGQQQFGTRQLPGVADAVGEFKDTRPEPFGPIPQSLGHWNGLYVQGDNVIFSYTVLGANILELPKSIVESGQVGFVRQFKIEKAHQPVSLMICEVAGANGRVEGSQAILTYGQDSITAVGLVDAPRGATLEIAENQRVVLKLPKNGGSSDFSLVIWNGAKHDKPIFEKMLANKFEKMNAKNFGPTRWPESVVTKGVLNFNTTPDGAYAVDQLAPPTENPWNRRVRFGGLDFFSDGKRAALSTWDGDIWIVSGIDEKLENLTWKRFASGGFETLGLKIVKDVIYTSGRDQITRYHDLNNDGEADFYENFNNEFTSSAGFHEFVFDLKTDSKGNFYFCKAGPVRGGGRGFGGDNFGTVTANAGTMLKFSKDGRKMEVYATGFRAPNGMGIGPNDEITTSDNEGTWVPACPINWVEKDGFYGVETLAHKNPIPVFKQPLCWMSHVDADNSGGSQVWVTSDKWGGLKEQLLHLSYGKSMLYLVLKEQISKKGSRDAQMQGGIVKIPVKFTSSAMRGVFNPKDGQLYIAGLQGWQTTAPKITGLDRVRYTGKPFHTVNGLHVKKNSIELNFNEPLDPESANDAQNYSAKRWNYNRAENYGSPELSVADPKKPGRDDLPIQAAKLSADGKTVTLEIADLKPVMQQSITYILKAKDGTELNQTVQHTINAIPE